MERGNTVAGGGLSTVTGTGGSTSSVAPCPHCGMEGETDPVTGVACGICGETPESTYDTGPEPYWSCHVCGESTGVSDDGACTSCGTELTGSELPPPPPSITVTNPDGTTSTVTKNLDGTVTHTGAPVSMLPISGGGMPELDQFVEWRARSDRGDGTAVQTGVLHGMFGDARVVRQTQSDGSGLLTVRIPEDVDLGPFGSIPAGEHSVDFDSNGTFLDADGNALTQP
jgi:hypothetical protein